MAPITALQKRSDSTNSQNEMATIKPKRMLVRRIGRKVLIYGLAAYMPISAAIMTGCEKNFNEKRSGIIEKLVQKKDFSPEIVSVLKELRKNNSWDGYEPFQIGDATGYNARNILIMQAPGINSSNYFSSSAHRHVTIADFKFTSPKMVRYQNRDFDYGRIESITKALNKLGYSYDMFFKLAFDSELTFVTSNGITITIKDPYTDIFVKMNSKIPKPPDDRSAVQKAIDYIEKFGAAAFFAVALFGDPYANTELFLSFAVLAGIEMWVESLVDDVNANRRSKDLPSSYELQELEKYASIILPGKSLRGKIYPFVGDVDISLFILGRLPEKSYVGSTQEELFSYQKSTHGPAVGVPVGPSSNEYFLFYRNKYESIKRTLDQNGIRYNLALLTTTTDKGSTTTLLFILDTPNKVVVGLDSFIGYGHGACFLPTLLERNQQ